ncbi:hypothetical protein BN1708_005119 [Verticillium longisporum]|uniref:Uncharacterized protein n=1 Tax=Verticillium longisporum TaxID=100787 RepID=A0A0G4M6T9_VERLO|nr:hypothetical protein BN1708_005119 [Verticillium longisporum]
MGPAGVRYRYRTVYLNLISAENQRTSARPVLSFSASHTQARWKWGGHSLAQTGKASAILAPTWQSLLLPQCSPQLVSRPRSQQVHTGQ